MCCYLCLCLMMLLRLTAGALPRYPSGSAGAGGSLHGGSAAYGAGLLAGSIGSGALPHSVSTSALPDPDYGCEPPPSGALTLALTLARNHILILTLTLMLTLTLTLNLTLTLTQRESGTRSPATLTMVHALLVATTARPRCCITGITEAAIC